MLRKPAGFWTKGKGLEVVAAHVSGKISEEQAVAALRLACTEAGVDEAGTQGAFASVDAALLADVRWYARDVRKALGLPGLREQAAAAKAQAEIAAQK